MSDNVEAIRSSVEQIREGLFRPRPVGVVEPTTGERVPTGSILMRGQRLRRAEYPELWAWIERHDLAGPGKPFRVDDEDTFTLPYLSGRTAGLPVEDEAITIEWAIGTGRRP